MESPRARGSGGQTCSQGFLWTQSPVDHAQLRLSFAWLPSSEGTNVLAVRPPRPLRGRRAWCEDG
eukprot:5352137-Prymnesium_polylepis.1